ncbi:MAG: hypothetical protein U0163_14310 [Gemmatimonadaceae bacterium]
MVETLRRGQPDGAVSAPGDRRLHPAGWFWHPAGGVVRTADDLMSLYFTSVGGTASSCSTFHQRAPDCCTKSMANLLAFGQARGLLAADAMRGARSLSSPAGVRAVDGDPDSFWAAVSATSGVSSWSSLGPRGVRWFACRRRLPADRPSSDSPSKP